MFPRAWLSKSKNVRTSVKNEKPTWELNEESQS